MPYQIFSSNERGDLFFWSPDGWESYEKESGIFKTLEEAESWLDTAKAESFPYSGYATVIRNF